MGGIKKNVSTCAIVSFNLQLVRFLLLTLWMKNGSYAVQGGSNVTSTDKTLVCYHSNESYIEQYFHVVLSVTL